MHHSKSNPVSQTLNESFLSNTLNHENQFTSDINKEVSIFINEDPIGRLKPLTIMDIIEGSISEFAYDNCFFFERNSGWQTWTWGYFHSQILNFAKAIIKIGIEPYNTVNIIGNNSPEWLTAFIGGMYSCVIPVGIYPTNNSETCLYIAEHSNCACLVLSSIFQYKKYQRSIIKITSLKCVVIYDEKITSKDIESFQTQQILFFTWRDFISIGEKSTHEDHIELGNRIKMQKPGNCCNIVYTSGTTGPPKAVMLSHDNMTWVAQAVQLTYPNRMGRRNRIVSYLPLSHIAGQICDIMRTLNIITFSFYYGKVLYIFRKTGCFIRFFASNNKICTTHYFFCSSENLGKITRKNRRTAFTKFK
jgi:long-chain-fatty-acid--CoA ligase ACSBG